MSQVTESPLIALGYFLDYTTPRFNHAHRY
jgi:hypothetical protein